MRTNPANLILKSADVLEMETRLCAEIRHFVEFSNHALFFPPENEYQDILYLPSERKLFLPLERREQRLGVLLLEGVRSRQIKPLLPHLDAIISRALECLALCRSIKHDFRTGLHTEEELFTHMEKRAAQIHSNFADPAQTSEESHRICMGMIVLRWTDSRAVGEKFDYDFRENIFDELGARLDLALPKEAVCAPLGRYDGRHEYGILFSASGRKICHKLASGLIEKLEAASFADNATRKYVNIKLHAGFALYPQDMPGDEFGLPVFEQTMRLRDRARFAAAMASRSASVAVMPYASILKRGGRIVEAIGGGKYRINLGLAANAREGMRFQIIDENLNIYKGQIVLLEAGPKESLAEIVFLEDAGNLPAVGDRLVLGHTEAESGFEAEFQEEDDENKDRPNCRLQLWNHGEFLSAFSEASRFCKCFVLGVSRGIKNVQSELQMETYLQKMDEFLEHTSRNAPELMPSLAGRYGSNSFIFFHAETKASTSQEFFKKLTDHAKENGVILSCGLFAWPFLNFGKNESEACAFRALEYAQLLPEPHIGIFDSVALNISADRLFNQGDSFGAMEEYKLALLADPANALARNSLGVCLAGMGKLEEAKKHCLDALKFSSDHSLDAKIYYNLGTISQKLEDEKNARQYFRQCLKLEPRHLYAGLRLGQLYEKKGRRANARKLYESVLSFSQDNPDTANLAERSLARLAAAQAGNKKARELLHNALLRNPDDAASLVLLAQMYLKEKEDPVLAETLARKAVNILGDKASWQTLAEALKIQGKEAEAEKALARAAKNRY